MTIVPDPVPVTKEICLLLTEYGCACSIRTPKLHTPVGFVITK